MLAIHGVNKPCLVGSAQGTAAGVVNEGAKEALDGKMGGKGGWLMDNPILQSLLRPPWVGNRLTLF
jgi:hypothetical protein